MEQMNIYKKWTSASISTMANNVEAKKSTVNAYFCPSRPRSIYPYVSGNNAMGDYALSTGTSAVHYERPSRTSKASSIPILAAASGYYRRIEQYGDGWRETHFEHGLAVSQDHMKTHYRWDITAAQHEFRITRCHR